LKLSINEDGIYDCDTYTISCADALRCGRAFAESCHDVVVGSDRNCEAVFHALTSGILSGSGNVWSIGNCTQAQLKYAVRVSGAGGGIFIQNCSGNIRLVPFSEAGHALVREEEKNLLQNLQTEYDDVYNEEGKLINSSTLIRMYSSDAARLFSAVRKADIRINSSNPVIRELCEELTDNNTSDHFSSVTFSVSDDGMRASAYSCETGFVFYEKLILICCIDEFEKGNDVALPYSFPMIADRIASGYNQNIYRFDPFSENAADTSRKEISLEFPFLYDALYLINRVVRIMLLRKKSLAMLLDDIPDFTTAVKYINLHHDENCEESDIRSRDENDVVCRCDNGRIIARKSRSGKSLILFAESYSTESADELCCSWLSDHGMR